MAKKLKTVRDLWDFAFDGLSAGGDRATMTHTVVSMGIKLDASLPKHGNGSIPELCRQIVALAKQYPEAGEYFGTVVKAAKATVKLEDSVRKR